MLFLLEKAAYPLLKPSLRTLEETLENSGRWEKAQILRKWQHGHSRISWTREWVLLEFLCEEYCVRQMVQREAALMEETGNCDPNVRAAYMNATARLYCLEIAVRKSAPGRAILSLRRQGKWYLSNSLRAFCAWQGGCCSRKCGCCEKPRSRATLQGQGHCTPACACCEKARGFVIPETGEEENVYAYSILRALQDPDHNQGILNAYVWGV